MKHDAKSVYHAEKKARVNRGETPHERILAEAREEFRALMAQEREKGKGGRPKGSGGGPAKRSAPTKRRAPAKRARRSPTASERD